MRARWFGGSLAALLVLGVYATPYLTLHQIRNAAQARDGAALARHIDFDAVRTSLKRGMQTRLLGRDLNEAGQPTPASVMGAAVAGALLGPMVDALITPASLARVLQGQRPAEAVVPQPQDSLAEPAEPLETQMGYESLNRFVFSVRKQGDDEEPIDLVLWRDGVLGWKLAELRLP